MPGVTVAVSVEPLVPKTTDADWTIESTLRPGILMTNVPVPRIDGS